MCVCARCHLIRPRNISPEAWQPILAAQWRVKNGLEHWALVCLLQAPQALEDARGLLAPSDILTPAYAALAALLFDPLEGAKAAEIARDRGIRDLLITISHCRAYATAFATGVA